MDTITDWHCTWLTGPDAGARHPLPIGRHLIGRARTADLRCDDQAMEAHHALLEVRPDGSVRCTQLSGRTPIRTPGPPTGELTDGDRVEIGSSVLELRRGNPSSAAEGTVVGGSLVRSPRAVPRWEPAEVGAEPNPPGEPDRPGGLVPALLGLGGAGLIALLARQPMFLLFGAMGATVAVGSWAAQRLAGRRTRTRQRADHAAAVIARQAALADDRSRFAQWHLARVPTLESALADTRVMSTAVWSRRADHDDAFLVSLGRADQPWRGATVPDLPSPAALGPGNRLAITGPAAMSLARASIAQLAASCGPADLRMVVVTDRPGAWDCIRSLPHVALPDGTSAVVDESRLADVMEALGTRDRAHLLIITDVATALATRTSPLRRAVGNDQVALLAVLGDEQGVPHLCTAILGTDHGSTARWVTDTSTSMQSVPVRWAGLGERATFAHSAALARLQDPEDPLMADSRLPREVSLTELLTASATTVSAEGIAERWATHAGTDPAPRTAIGIADDGIVDLDLVRDGPHGLLAGTTGAGKSELLRTLVAGLAVNIDPAHLAMVLVDYKGGATFDALRHLPHVVGVVTDLDDDLADRALRSLQAELRRREAMLRDHAVADLAGLRAVAPDVLLPRLLVVIDEFAALVAEQPDFLHALVGVAQRGRSLGVHLLLATQRPHGVISDDIRANTNLRVALRLQDAEDALDVVGDRAPAQLPRGVPGRAVMRLGADEHLTFQTAYADRDELTALVDAVIEAARRSGLTPPPAPWLAPLPATLCRSDLPADAIGLCDDPDRQSRRPLRWTPSDGSVAVAGCRGSGVSSALRTLAVQALTDPHTHVYLLTTRPDHPGEAGAALTLDHHPRCVSVGVHERERLVRLLHRLRTAGPRSDGAPTPVLVIDGFDGVRRALDHADSTEEYDALDEVLANPDLTVVVGTDRPAALPSGVVARCAQRWVLHLHDPHDAGPFGTPARSVPQAVPGRVFVQPLGLVAQLVQPDSVPLHHVTVTVTATDLGHDVAPVSPIDVIPDVVPSEVLRPGRHEDDADRLPIGLDVATGDPFEVEVPDGDHVLVLGSSRSGRSHTLGRLTLAWRQAHPSGRVVAILPRRSAFDRSWADDVFEAAIDDLVTIAPIEATLLVCDDAELIDDPDGRLAAVAGGRQPGTTIVAAARPDALRHLYGHWTSVLRRSRLGIVATGGGESDGDLLGAVLPRRVPIAARPGLAWVVSQGSVHLVQTAVDTDRRVQAHATRLTPR